MNSLLGITRYELRMQLRSLVFWVAVMVCLLMFYSEVWDGAASLALAWERANAGMLRNPEWIYKITSQPLSRELGPIFADRMGIVLSFVVVFLLGFVLDRDRLAQHNEIISTRPYASWQYIMGKYLAVMTLVLGLVVSTGLVGFWATARAASVVGSTVELKDFVEPIGQLLLPTLLYAGALSLVLAVSLRSGAAVAPVYMLYFVASFVGLSFQGSNNNFGFSTFVVRSDGWGEYSRLMGELGQTLLYNRILYGGLTILFLVVAVCMYERTRISAVGAPRG